MTHPIPPPPSEELKKIWCKLDEYSDFIGINKARLDNLQTQIEAISGDVSGSIQYQIDDLKSQVSKLSNYNDTELRNQIASLQSAVAVLEQYSDADIREQINELQTKVNQLHNYDDSEVWERINDLEQTVRQILENGYDDSELRNLISELQFSVTDLQQRDTEFAEELTALNSTLTGTKEALETLQEKFDDCCDEVKQSISELQEADKALSSEIESERSARQRDNELLVSTIGELTTTESEDVTRIEANLQSLSDRVTDIENSYAIIIKVSADSDFNVESVGGTLYGEVIE